MKPGYSWHIFPSNINSRGGWANAKHQSTSWPWWLSQRGTHFFGWVEIPAGNSKTETIKKPNKNTNAPESLASKKPCFTQKSCFFSPNIFHFWLFKTNSSGTNDQKSRTFFLLFVPNLPITMGEFSSFSGGFCAWDEMEGLQMGKTWRDAFNASHFSGGEKIKEAAKIWWKSFLRPK